MSVDPALLETFHRTGYLVIEQALLPDQVDVLRDGVEAAFQQPDEETSLRGGTLAQIWRPRMFERGAAFEAVVDNPRLLDLVEAILGPECHLIANSALKTGPGDGISAWHADETVRFPRPADVPLDPRIPMPCFILGVNYSHAHDLHLDPPELVGVLGEEHAAEQDDRGHTDLTGLRVRPPPEQAPCQRVARPQKRCCS